MDAFKRNFIASLQVIPDLSPQSAILGFYDLVENTIIINQIHLIFKIAIYNSKSSQKCSIRYIINKIKGIKRIEDNITFFDERKRLFNNQKWAGIEGLI